MAYTTIYIHTHTLAVHSTQAVLWSSDQFRVLWYRSSFGRGVPVSQSFPGREYYGTTRMRNKPLCTLTPASFICLQLNKPAAHSELSGKPVYLFNSQGNMIPTTALCNTASGRLGAKHEMGCRVLSLSIVGELMPYQIFLSPSCFSFLHPGIPGRPLPVPAEVWVTPVHQPCCTRQSQEKGVAHAEPDVFWTGRVSISVCVCVFVSGMCV